MEGWTEQLRLEPVALPWQRAWSASGYVPYSERRSRALDDLSHQLEQQIPRLRRYAMALVGDTARADDLVQDCLERAWTKGHLFQRGSDLRAWLFTILHNLHANASRRFNTGPSLVPLTDDSLAPSVPPTQLEGLQIGEIKTALARVSDDQRHVLLMVGMEQMTYEEVAKVLGIPIGTVMSRLHRGREKLRELLAQGGGWR